MLGGQAKAKAASHGGVIPATPILAEVERSMSGKMGRELVLRKALKDVRKEHDLVLIDCPPALGLLTINGLVAADWALVSSEAQYFALQGVEGALEVVEQAKEFYNPDLELLGVVLNIADMRTKHSREAFEQLKEHYGEKVFETVIRSSIAYAESAEKGVSILDHRPDLGTDYLALADEVLRRVGLKDARKKLKPLLGGLSSDRAAPRRCVLVARRGGAAAAAARAAAERRGTRPPRGRGESATTPFAVARERRAGPRGRVRWRPPALTRADDRAARRARAAAGIGRLRPRTEFGSPKVVSVLRRRGGWLRVVAPELANGRRGWIRARRDARLGAIDVSLHVDRSAPHG